MKSSLWKILGLIIIVTIVVTAIVWSKDKSTRIAFKNPPIIFETPENYGILLKEFSHPVRFDQIFVGEKIGNNQFRNTLNFEVFDHQATDPQMSKSPESFGSLEQYLKSFTEYVGGPAKNLTLFGNPAAQLTLDFDGSTVIVGFLRGDQTQDGTTAIVRISGGYEGTEPLKTILETLSAAP